MKNNVCKWGGSSLADGNKVSKVIEYIKKTDTEIVVFSAPGKRDSLDTKVTDMLIVLSKDISNLNLIANIQSRYLEIIKALQIDFDIKKHLLTIINNYKKTKNTSYLISRGEWLIAKIIAKKLNYYFADTKNIIKFDKAGKLKNCTYKKIQKVVAKYKKVVFPGFYGGYKNKVKIFSRGGSDISGAIISKALKLDYINFTDVDGIYSKYPLTSSCKKLKIISYQDLKFLGLFGFNVLHHKCCDILGGTNLKTTIKSSFEPQKQGTTVVSDANNVVASSSFSGLIASSESNIYNILLNNNIYVLFNYKYQNTHFYITNITERKKLDSLKIRYQECCIKACVNKKLKNAIYISPKHQLVININKKDTPN